MIEILRVLPQPLQTNAGIMLQIRARQNGSTSFISHHSEPGSIVTAGVRLRTGARDITLLRSVQTGTGCHPTSYPMDTGGFFHEGKAAGT
jgi:hypothetical protein